jgi:hypothetical protein
VASGYRGGYTDGGAANPTGTINISNHASAAKGDVAIVQIYSRSSSKDFGTISGPTAITGYPASTANGGKVWLGYKVLTATDITNGYLGTWAPTTLSNATTGVSVAGFSGVKASAPVSAQATPVAGGASDPNPPALVATSGYCLVVCFGTMDQNDGVTAPANFTLTTAANWSTTAGSDGSAGMAYDLDGGTGSSVDPAVFATTTDAYWYAGHIALAPQPAPAVTSLDVTSGSENGGTAVTITGTSFYGVVPASGVTFGGTAATSVVVVSDTSITCVTPAHAVGSDLQTQVTGPGGASSDVAGDNFTFTAAVAGGFDPFGMSGYFGM